MCVGKLTSDKLTSPFSGSRNKYVAKGVEFLHENEKLQYQADILAISTYYTKIILFTVGDWCKSLQNSLCYKILFHTTQPAHFVAILSVVIVSLLFLPSDRKTVQSPIWSLIYLGSFSAHLGAQIWMTFISGLSLYFALPRHHFGNVQKVLFPKYFLLNAILSLITLYVFVRAHNNEFTTIRIAIQTGAMTLCFLTELLIWLYLTPPLLRLITVKNQIESGAGVGMEVGQLIPGNLLKCPHYLKIHKAFRRVHMTIAIGNIIAMVCTVLHLHFLSQKVVYCN